MLRRALFAVPLLAAAAAFVGTLLADRPVLAVLVATALGAAVALLIMRAGERRVGEIADRVARFAEGDAPTRLDVRGSQQWRRLAAALNAVAESLQRRLDQLTSERARVERLLDDLPPAILLFTGDSLAYANRSARTMFEPREAGTPLQVLGLDPLAGAVREARETGRAVTVEATRDGEVLRARAAVTGTGETALVVSDLTGSRRLAEVRRDFVTNASHELKTPVAAMQALADSLAAAVERDPARARHMVGLLQHEAARLAQLVRDLLDLTRLEEASAGDRRRRVDLAAIVRAECKRLAPLAEARHVSVRVDAPADATLVAVPDDVRLIVANLLENAVQYNREGGEVRVRALREDALLVLEVSDTGIGIAEADRDRVFERFYRVDRARSRAHGGTGLGLAIVRHAAQRLGGEVRVDAVLGEGSTFRVHLPVASE